MTHDDQHDSCNPDTCPTAATHRANLDQLDALREQLDQVRDERDERLTLAESSHLAKLHDQAVDEIDGLYRDLNRAHMERDWLLAEAPDPLRSRYFAIKAKQTAEKDHGVVWAVNDAHANAIRKTYPKADVRVREAASVPRTARETTDAPLVGGQAEQVAHAFHDEYEGLAPLYGYKTREASAKPWSEVPEQNRLLMIHTVARVLARMELGKLPPAEGAGPKAERPIDLNLGVPEWLKEVDQYRWRDSTQAPKHPTSSEARAVLDHAIATALPQSGGAVEHLLLDLRAALAEVDRKRATQGGSDA